MSPVARNFALTLIAAGMILGLIAPFLENTGSLALTGSFLAAMAGFVVAIDVSRRE